MGDRPAERREAETQRDREDLGGAAGVAQSRVAPGFQSGSSGAGQRVRGAGEDEEKVGESVEVDDDQRAKLVARGSAQRLPLGAPADRARDVEPRRRLRPAREHEAPELGEVGVEPVTVLLEPVDHRLLDAKPALDSGRDGEICADVEELVLDALEDPTQLARNVADQTPGRELAFSSSTVPNASMRPSSFETRDPSPSDVSPSSPPRV